MACGGLIMSICECIQRSEFPKVSMRVTTGGGDDKAVRIAEQISRHQDSAHAGKIAEEEKSLRRAFSQAVLVNVLNPKSALFFFAFLPQFINPERGAAATQILYFGAIVILLGFASGSLYSLLAASIGSLLRENLKFLRAQRYFAASVYLGLGATTALTGSSRK